MLQIKPSFIKSVGIAALLLVLALPLTALPVWVYAEENASSETASTDAVDVSGSAEKREVVYAALDTTGAVQDEYVVNVIEGNPGDVVQDFGVYDDVTNVTDTSDIAHLSDSVIFTMSEDSFTYQGTVADALLPWNIAISYVLDGQEVTAQDLAGATGELTLEINTTQNTAVDSRYYENYLMQVSLTLPMDKATNIQTDDGSIALSGSDVTVTFMMMPDSDGSASLSADIKDFEMEGISFAAVPFSIALDFPDTDSLVSSFDELIEGTEELASGTEEVQSGVDSIDAAAQELAAGALEVTNGASQITQGLQQYRDSLYSNASDMESSVSDAELEEAQAAYQTAQQNYITQIVITYQTIVATDPNIDAESALTQAIAQTDQSELQAALQNLITVASTQAGMSAAADALEEAADGLGSTSDSSSLLGGAVSLENGTEELASALDQLAGGTGELSSGVDELTQGTSTLAQETQGIPDAITEEIDELMSSYDTSDFEPASYMSSKNTNVTLVQFVFTTDSISVDEPEESDDEEEEQTIADRFFALFS